MSLVHVFVLYVVKGHEEGRINKGIPIQQSSLNIFL